MCLSFALAAASHLPGVVQTPRGAVQLFWRSRADFPAKFLRKQRTCHPHWSEVNQVSRNPLDKVRISFGFFFVFFDNYCILQDTVRYCKHL